MIDKILLGDNLIIRSSLNHIQQSFIKNGCDDEKIVHILNIKNKAKMVNELPVKQIDIVV